MFELSAGTQFVIFILSILFYFFYNCAAVPFASCCWIGEETKHTDLFVTFGTSAKKKVSDNI